MSIQRKLMLTISLLMFITLLLNVIFSHINSLTLHRKNLSQQIETIANQLTVTLKLIEDTNMTLEHEMARSLQGSAKAAEQLLPNDYHDISNEMLIALAKKLNIQGITLWIMDDQNELISVKSSNPEEILLRSKTWDYWDVAMKEVFNLEPISVKLGEKLSNFYSGPLNFSVTDPSKISKFGYYYSGKTNYMINTIVTTDQVYEFGYLEEKQAIVDNILSHVDGLVEITAINPTYFGKEKILKMKNGQLVQNLDVRDIIFGEYTIVKDDSDIQAVQDSIRDSSIIKNDFKYNGLDYSRVFVPIMSESPYVISFVFSNEVMLEETFEKLTNHIVISVFLFILAIIVTNFMARHFVAPILQIKEKVRHIAKQNFDFPLHIKSKDEVGVLATHVNEMSQRLELYTTELKQTANQLEQTEHQLKSFITLTNDPIVFLNLDLHFYHVNDAYIRLFGYSLEDVMGKSLSSMHQKQEEEINIKLNAIITNGFIDQCELDLVTKKGELKRIGLSLSPILDINEKCIGLAGIMHDMTEHYDKKELRLQNEKLAAISQLSAIIAHEFRNPLTTLHGFLKLSEQRGQLSADFIPTLLKELEHMELILGQFLTLAKPQAYKLTKLNIQLLLSDITNLLQSSGKLEKIEIIWSTLDDNPYILGDNKYIRQAFVNIIKNSIEAMPTGGTITISVIEKNHYIDIMIKDTGIGISSEQLSKIFDPFYTNKEFGTGLGLLVTQQIINDHKGDITYSSELNKGTIVSIKFPKFM